MRHFTVRDSGSFRSCATSSQVAMPGVGTFAIASVAGARGAAGAIASAFSTLAA
jgi:hypothetical protein